MQVQSVLNLSCISFNDSNCKTKISRLKCTFPIFFQLQFHWYLQNHVLCHFLPHYRTVYRRQKPVNKLALVDGLSTWLSSWFFLLLTNCPPQVCLLSPLIYGNAPFYWLVPHPTLLLTSLTWPTPAMTSCVPNQMCLGNPNNAQQLMYSITKMKFLNERRTSVLIWCSTIRQTMSCDNAIIAIVLTLVWYGQLSKLIYWLLVYNHCGLFKKNYPTQIFFKKLQLLCQIYTYVHLSNKLSKAIFCSIFQNFGSDSVFQNWIRTKILVTEQYYLSL